MASGSNPPPSVLNPPTAGRQPETGRSFPNEPMITITETALQKIVELKERLEARSRGSG